MCSIKELSAEPLDMTDMNEDLRTYIIKKLCRSTCAMESINMVADWKSIQITIPYINTFSFIQLTDWSAFYSDVVSSSKKMFQYMCVFVSPWIIFMGVLQLVYSYQ